MCKRSRRVILLNTRRGRINMTISKLAKKIIQIIINITLLGVFIYSSYCLYISTKNYKTADSTYNEVKVIKEESNDHKNDLFNINEDFKYWIMIDNTNIDYPVVQGKDNEYYLNRDFYGENNKSGTIFMDYRNDWKNDKNTILYGHNMRNKTMFENIELYKNEDFFLENNKIRIIEGKKEHVYEVFSVYVVEPTFNYIRPNFDTDEEFKQFLNDISKMSMHKANLGVNVDDNIITLSTCSYEFKNARTVVHGKLISRN